MSSPHTSPPELLSPADDHTRMILDGTKIDFHMDRLEAWERGEHIAPITIDMALTRKCDAACSFCFAMLQENERSEITLDHMEDFLVDSARMGVRAISLVSDGESLLSRAYVHTIQRGSELGISMASGTNGRAFTPDKLEAVLPYLDYLRFNVSAGTQERYTDIMGLDGRAYNRVLSNIRRSVDIKREGHLRVTLGIQMVLMPDMGDQIMPFAELGKDLGVDYAIIKHCSDDEYGNLGIDYGKYGELTPLLEEAEALSTPTYSSIVKWSKIGDKGKRDYQRCYGPPFLIQISGSGLVAPCGMLFSDRYGKFHIGNITEQRWYDIWQSDRYWEVMKYLSSDDFDAQVMCGSLCLQHYANTVLDQHVKGIKTITPNTGPEPLHLNFV
jgi:MoaA/NifB/PqqE/SkfB family radical SAM enzyme